MHRILTVLLVLLISSPILAQQKININDGSTFYVDGTSTIHDWTVNVGKINGSFFIKKNSPVYIDSVRFNIPISSMKSGKSGMDSRMYEALKSKRHPVITFVSSDVIFTNDTNGVANGYVTIAGVKQPVSVPFTTTQGSNSWTFSGQVSILMTQFSIDPPVALMGTIRTGDEVTIRFEINTPNQ